MLERNLSTIFSCRICDGERNPEDVLREQVDKYRRVFVQAMEQVIFLPAFTA